MSGFTVSALCIGAPAALAGGKRSAIGKHPVDGPVAITKLGLAGDIQVDRRHHGGPDMAVHLYPLAHHPYWRAAIGDHPLLAEPGAFGGNLAVDGIAEGDVRLGQRFRLGTALLEVSQPRMPCATIERRFGHEGMVGAILRSGRCGWYFRVVEEGLANAGDRIEPIVDSGGPWTIASVFAALAVPSPEADDDLLAALAHSPVLGADWRKRALVRLQGH